MPTNTPRSVACVVIALFAASAFALHATQRQSETDHDRPEHWRAFEYFVGSWEGVGDGLGGQSTVTKTYRFVLAENFLQEQTKSLFPPQEKNPNGETHEDWGMISYDKAREMFVFRQFHSEGFVCEYDLESVSDDGQTIVFTTTAIENFVPGGRARLVYQIANADEYAVELFLAGPGGDFKSCVVSRMSRSGPS